MIIVKNRELLIPNNERYIGTTYDTETENRIFQVPRYSQRGVDLAALTFRLDIQYANESYDTIVLDKEIGEAFVILIWRITSSTLQVPGTMYIGLRAVDNEATVKWSSFSAAMYVERHLNTPGNYGGGLTEIEQMEQDHQYMKGVVNELKEHLDYTHEAEAWAVGKKDGEDVPSTDPTYHNNSKYYSEQAGASATAAANSATAAAGSATAAHDDSEAVAASRAQIAQNASNIAIQTARIDQFTHLAEGSTTGDAELMDARVGADGVTYASAGAATRANDSLLKSQIDTKTSYARIVGSVNFRESFSTTSMNRLFKPCALKGGQCYRVVLTNIKLPAKDPNTNVYLSLKTTTAVDNTQVVDTIFEDSGITANAVYEKTFVASANSSYLYLYISTQAGDVDIDVQVYSSTLKNIDAIVNLATPISNNHVSLTHTSEEMLRAYAPTKIKKGSDYIVRLTIPERYTAQTGTIVFSLKTTTQPNNTSVVDYITEDIYNTISAGEYWYPFTASGDANYFYVYERDSGTSFECDIALIGNIVDSMLENEPGTTGDYSYDGQRINLKSYKYTFNFLMSTTKPSGLSNAWQGACSFGDYLFRLTHGGSCAVYDLGSKSGTAIASFNLGSYDPSNNHANCANFGSNYYAQGDEFPLMYVTDGNSAEVMKCSVERITRSGNVFSSSLVQTITLDQTDFETYGYVPYWGWSQWLIADDALYYFGAKYRTNGSMSAYDGENKYIITKFNIPSVSSSEVTLTASDVKEQWTSPYDVNVTQGGCIYGDYLFYAFGFGYAAYPSIIKVFSLSQKICVAKIKLTGTPLASQELEDVFVYDDNLIVTSGGNDIYSMEF